ncbi:MAG: hypothetical protein ABSF44_00810 [Candidatus Bathyarchaeia archaeon]|jgi:hypothetical protein
MGMSVKSVIRNYAIQHYGNLISVGEPEFDPEGKGWIAELQSDYPRIIHDDRCPEERIVKFLSLRRLGAIKVAENLQSIEATSRDDCVNNLSDYLNIWQERAEKIIVKASSDKLAKTNEAKFFLGKIGMIISRLKWNKTIPDSDIDALPIKEAIKLRKYLQLLESLEIVEHENNRYSYGNMFTELCVGTDNDPEKLNTSILSHIIKTRYSALRETFGISQLETVVHVDSCYYRPALEAEELIYWKKDSFEHHIAMLYGTKSKVYFRLPYVLEELVNVKAIEYQDNLYFGNASLFKEMKNAYYEMGEVSLPRA